jgi:hypothetical protein
VCCNAIYLVLTSKHVNVDHRFCEFYCGFHAFAYVATHQPVLHAMFFSFNFFMLCQKW